MGLAAVVLLQPGSAVAAGDRERIDLDPLMGGEQVWELGADEFAKKYIKEDALGSFAWVSSAKASARLEHLSRWEWTAKDGTKNKLSPTIGGGQHEIGEVIVRFEDEMVSRVEMSVYNRGDDGEISKAEFQDKLREITAFLESKLKVKYENRPASSRKTASGLLWRTKEGYFLLEYSFRKEDRAARQRFRPEYIMIKVAPSPGKSVAKNVLKTRSDLRREVVKEDNGDVLIKTVPMVDQGQKGYCAVASAERVMRYYGIDVSQHEMAQISNSSRGGTSGKEMTRALAAAAGKYHTRVLTHFEFDYEDEKGWKDMEKVAKAYNRLAKKAGKAQFDTDKYWIPIGQLLSQGDPELLKEARATGVKYERFKSKVHNYIDDGVPLLWALWLGVFKEDGLPQSGGGHMRLIIGYNRKTEEIIYSDSWGAGHEVKRMSMDEAYTMTMQLTTLQPSS